jgi:hemoglobin
MSQIEDHQIAEAIGEAMIADVVAAFYRRVPEDRILGPLYPADDMDGAAARLTGFLIFRFGGSQDYLQQRGHPALRMRHAPFVVNQAARDHWYALMDAAINECEVPEPAATAMRQFLSNTATFLINSTPDEENAGHTKTVSPNAKKPRS